MDATSQDSEIIFYALLMWRNYIQTGDVSLSSHDAVASGQKHLCKVLDRGQMEMVIRLEDLSDRILNSN